MFYLLGLAIGAWIVTRVLESAGIDGAGVFGTAVLVISLTISVPFFLLSSFAKSLVDRAQDRADKRETRRLREPTVRVGRQEVTYIVDGRSVVNDNRTVVNAGEKPKGGAYGTEKRKEIDG